MVRILRDGGMQVEAHGTHFRPTAHDHEWLGPLARNGWVGITKDDRIRYSPLAVETVMRSGSKLFIAIGTYTHERLARNIFHSRHKLDQFVRKYSEPFIARLYMAPEHKFDQGRAGEIKVWKTEAQWRAESGRR